MAVIVEAENLVKRYGEQVAVDHFGFYVNEGEILGLLGPNGSGKTTLVRCILSLVPYEHGTIKLFGRPMAPDDYEKKARIGVVPQNIAVMDELTVYENIDYFCGLYIGDRGMRRQCVEDAVAFAGLEEYEKSYPARLSGGLLRRLNIACGIAHKPELIFFDEPTVAVDPKTRDRILEGIRDLNSQGATVVYISHYMEEIEQLCTRVVIMDKGRSIAEGSKEKLKGMLKNTESVTIEVPGISGEALQGLRSLPHAYEAVLEQGYVRIRFSGGKQNLLQVLDYMREKELLFGQVYTERPTLNDVFLEMTGREIRD